MKLLTASTGGIIQTKLRNKDLYLSPKYLIREFGLYMDIDIYLHSLAYLGFYDPLLPKKMQLWRKFISSSAEDAEKYYKKLTRFQREETKIIITALKKMEEDKIKNRGAGYGSLWKPFTWGCLTYEFQAGI